MKKYLIAGVSIILPVFITLAIVAFLFDFLTTPFLAIIDYFLNFAEMRLHFLTPSLLRVLLERLLALLLLCVTILFLGIIARGFYVRSVLTSLRDFLYRIPFVKTVIRTSHDLFSAIFSAKKEGAFLGPVMIPFPDFPNRIIGFAIKNIPSECREKLPFPVSAVLTPTSPHPISGFIVFLDQKNVQALDMTNEDAIKFIVSCGMVVPEENDKL